jgi:hypothetical protein
LSVKADGKRGFDYYALKDAEMTHQGDCGLHCCRQAPNGYALGLAVGPLAGPGADSGIQSFAQYVRALAGLVLVA